MKRRQLGSMLGTSLLAIALPPTAARAASTDPAQLTTTLTPMGAERAGNADGSIPAWTGGMVAPGTPVELQVFTDEKPLFTVTADNLSQHASLINPGTQAMMTKFGYSIDVFPTHRTAAAPQYVYDNTAKNLQTAKLNPAGGRLGFTGAYGGVAFPIIDTSDPLTAGAQLIWNHLTSWDGLYMHTALSPSFIVTDGTLILSEGTEAWFYYPFYDPKGSVETFDGYYSKLHLSFKEPASQAGEEQLVWHSTNVSIQPDITWELLNGQGRVRKAPNEAYDTPNPSTNGIANIDESSCFYGNPSKYDWKYIAKQEMLVPYNCNKLLKATGADMVRQKFPNPDLIRWEKHRVWVVEATLHPGEDNVLAKRRFYIDEDSWVALLGEGYDHDDNLVKAYAIYNCVVPALPGTTEFSTLVFNLQTGDYSFDGGLYDTTFFRPLDLSPEDLSDFDAEQMAAHASF